MTDSFTSAGLRISVVSEPLPLEEGRNVDPEAFRGLSRSPNFLFFVLETGYLSAEDKLRVRLGPPRLDPDHQ